MSNPSSTTRSTEHSDFLSMHARYYTTNVKGLLARMRSPELTTSPAHLTNALQFCLGERRWARRSLLALAH